MLASAKGEEHPRFDMNMFRDRVAAGQALAKALAKYAKQPNVVVIGLPRGGVPVAYELARALQLPLDVLIVRKLGAPEQPELAMGAIASGGITVINPELENWFDNFQELIDAAVVKELPELERRERKFRGDRAPLAVRGKTVIVVDDGAATGATMQAAVRALRQLGAREVVVALPVAAAETCGELKREADHVVCLHTPEPFVAVGQWYEDFVQTTDREVEALLAAEHLNDQSRV